MLYIIPFEEDRCAGDSPFYANGTTHPQVEDNADFQTCLAAWVEYDDNGYEDDIVGFWLLDENGADRVDYAWPEECHNDSMTYAANANAKRIAQKLAISTVLRPS